MQQQRERILQEIDSLLEIFKEQYSGARSNHKIIPLIELDLMKSSLQNLYKQITYLEKVQESSFEKECIVHDTNTINHQQASSVKEFTDFPESEINIPADNSIAFADLVIEEEKENSFPEIRNEFHKNPDVVNDKIDVKESDFVKAPTLANKDEVEKQLQEHAKYLGTTFTDKLDSAQNVNDEQKNTSETTEAAVKTAPPITVAEKKDTSPSKTSGNLFDQLSQETVAGKFKGQETLYSHISKSRNDETVADKLHKKPLTDLKKSIGINERFAFINELFAGNQQKFSETIDKLNGFSSFDEADSFVTNDLVNQFNWNVESDSFKELNALIKRRFGM